LDWRGFIKVSEKTALFQIKGAKNVDLDYNL